MTFSQRERARARLVGLRAYYGRPFDGDPSQRRAARAAALEEALQQLPVGGVLPDAPGTLIAHCGTWWPLKELPWVAPCCGWMLRAEDVRARKGEG